MIAAVQTTAADTWRVRLAWAVDIMSGIAACLVPAVVLFLQQALLGLFNLWRSALWHEFFLAGLWFGLFGVILAGHVLLARRGRTIGLALMRLRWRTPLGQPAARRLLGEPRLWCAAGPALYFILAALCALLLSLNPAWNAYAMWVIYGLACVLVLGAVVVMVLARRSPGRLIAHPFPEMLPAAHPRRAVEWGVLGLGALVTYLAATMYDAPANLWAQALTALIAVGAIVAAVLCAVTALYHMRRYARGA